MSNYSAAYTSFDDDRSTLPQQKIEQQDAFDDRSYYSDSQRGSLSFAGASSSYYPSTQPLQNIAPYNQAYIEVSQRTQIDCQETPQHFYYDSLSRNYTSSLGMALNYQYATGSSSRSTAATSLSDSSSAPLSTSSTTILAAIETTSLPTAPVCEQYPSEMVVASSNLDASQPMQTSITQPQPTSHTPLQPRPSEIPSSALEWRPSKFAHLACANQPSATQMPAYTEEAPSGSQSPSFEPPMENSQPLELPSTPAYPSDSLPTLEFYQLVMRGSPPLEPFSVTRARRLKGLRHYSSESELSRWNVMDEETVDTTETTSQASAGPASEEGAEPPAKKRKKGKMHPCETCGKLFPRPSGLKIHMNTHIHVKPFTCEFPGCHRTFTVKSNAKRHLRTHGINPDLFSSRTDWSIDFEDPKIVPDGDNNIVSPSKFKWMPLALSSRFNATSPSRSLNQLQAGGDVDSESDWDDLDLLEDHHHQFGHASRRGPPVDVQRHTAEVTAGLESASRSAVRISSSSAPGPVDGDDTVDNKCGEMEVYTYQPEHGTYPYHHSGM